MDLQIWKDQHSTGQPVFHFRVGLPSPLNQLDGLAGHVLHLHLLSYHQRIYHYEDILRESVSLGCQLAY
jgi:hypothetical protein